MRGLDNDEIALNVRARHPPNPLNPNHKGWPSHQQREEDNPPRNHEPAEMCSAFDGLTVGRILLRCDGELGAF